MMNDSPHTLLGLDSKRTPRASIFISEIPHVDHGGSATEGGTAENRQRAPA